MTDEQFVERLDQELANRRRWPEIRSVTSSQTEPSLAANELLVYPAPTGEPDDPSVALRVVVEYLVLPAP